MMEQFVNNVVECRTPTLERVLKAREQFIAESDTNELLEEFVFCSKGVDIKPEDENWWGLMMCSLFEIHIAAVKIGICNE